MTIIPATGQKATTRGSGTSGVRPQEAVLDKAMPSEDTMRARRTRWMASLQRSHQGSDCCCPSEAAVGGATLMMTAMATARGGEAKEAASSGKFQSRGEFRPEEPKAHPPLPARGLGTLRPPALQWPLRRRHRRSWPQLRGEEWRPHF